MDINKFLDPSKKYKTDKSEQETSIQQEEIKDRTQDREERKKYALWTFVFLCIFTGIILGIIIASGLSELIQFHIANGVLITLITTSLTTVVSIFVFVMKYLFGKK